MNASKSIDALDMTNEQRRDSLLRTFVDHIEGCSKVCDRRTTRRAQMCTAVDGGLHRRNLDPIQWKSIVVRHPQTPAKGRPVIMPPPSYCRLLRRFQNILSPVRKVFLVWHLQISHRVCSPLRGLSVSQKAASSPCWPSPSLVASESFIRTCRG